MPPKRGVAAVRKPSKHSQYIYVDENDNEISPPRSTKSETGGSGRAKRAEKGGRHQGTSLHSSKPSADIPPPLTPQNKRGSEHRQGKRQDSAIHGEGEEQSILTHARLERTLFIDHKADENTHDSVQSIELAPAAPLIVSYYPDARPKNAPKRRLSRSPPDCAEAFVAPAQGLVSNQSATICVEFERQSQQIHPAPPAPLGNGQNTLSLDVDDMAAAYIPPNQHRHMRACMVCSIVRTETQFRNHGCPNCEAFLELAHNQDAIQDCTSQVFDGLITVSDTGRSWVARWQRLEGYVPGVYAVQVEGVLPEDVISAAESAGVHYIPRDGSVNEALPTDG